MAPEQDTRSSGEIAATTEDRTILGNPVVSRHAPDAKRAESRGVYVDPNGQRRVVAAGDPIPEGWELESDAALEDRAAATVTAQDGPADTPSGAPRSRKPSAPKEPVEDK